MATINWNRDELLLACALVVENGWHELRQTDPSVQELSDLLRSLPLHRDAAAQNPRFRSPNSVSRKTTDIVTARPDHTGGTTKGGALTKAVVADFLEAEEEMLAAAAAIRAAISSGDLHRTPPQADEMGEDDGSTAREGRLLTRLALHRERSPKLRARKIKDAEARGQSLACEVCAFEFERVYGMLGKGYIEVHHVQPLHVAGETETRLEDLCFLCANCHRMCHRSYRGEPWRTPEALKKMIR